MTRTSLGRVVPRRFYDRDAREVAPELLGKLLVDRSGDEVVAARLTEVEAYRGADDPGSHAFRGPTRRNQSMFGRPGTLYVYFIYGMHWCMNAVCGPGEQPHAVLLRAAVPVFGIDTIRSRRNVRRDRDLLSGPARLTEAFGIDGTLDGSDLVAGPLQILDDGTPPPEPVMTTRIGLARGRGDDLLLRYLAAP